MNGETYQRHDDRTASRPEVSGLLLRYAALVVMDGVTQPTSVAEITEAIERLGVRVPERKGKWVSDALRCEHRKGRIMRVGRNRYVGSDIPKRTRQRAMRAILELRRSPTSTVRTELGHRVA